MILIKMIISLGLAFLGMVALPLSGFLREVDDNLICNQCGMKKTCFGKKLCKRGKIERLNEFMLLSYYVLRKKCSHIKKCSIKNYIIYIIFSTILTSFMFYLKGCNLLGIVYVVTTATLLSLSVVDWNTQYIPLEMNGIILICGLIRLFTDFSNWIEYVIGLFAVSGFLYILNLIATPILQKKYEEEQEVDSVIGDGDIKLMAATGLLLGWKLNFFALGIGCIIGSIIHCILIKIKKGGRQFALGPYLAIGIYIAMLYGKQLISWYLNMMGVKPI